MTEPTPAVPDPVQQALALFRQQRLAEALPLLEQLVEAGNTPLACVLALAETRERTGDSAGAARLLTNLYRALPQEDFAVTLVATLLRAGDANTLDTLLPELGAAHPASTRLLAMQSEHALKQGDYPTGFALQPHRWAVAREPQATAALACPIWDGTPFAGTLLIGTEQGLGDVVLWSSLLTDLAARGQRSLIACDARLLPLFRRSFPTLGFADRALAPLAGPGTRPDNRRIEMPDLAPLLRHTDVSFPATGGWLQADHERTAALRARYQARFPGKKLVGVSWCSHRHLQGDTKNIPVTELAPLLGHPDIVAVSLQYGDIAPDLSELQASGLPLVVDPDIDLTMDIDGTCALATAMDLVVSSSNSLAHLAGALGLDTRVLVPGARYVLWYWGYETERTPWYPSVRILRGPPRNAWHELAATVARSLGPNRS